MNYYYVFSRRYDGWVYPRILVCGHMEDVWGHTSGPGGHGVSIACPKRAFYIELDGAHVRRSTPMAAGWYVSEHRLYAQVHGGFGDNVDGFWHYRLHNPLHGKVHARFYGICQ